MTDEIRDPREVRSFQEDIAWPSRVPVETDYYDFAMSYDASVPLIDPDKIASEVTEMVNVTALHGFIGQLRYLGAEVHSNGTRRFRFRRMKS